jgi:hypothetical protein
MAALLRCSNGDSPELRVYYLACTTQQDGDLRNALLAAQPLLAALAAVAHRAGGCSERDADSLAATIAAHCSTPIPETDKLREPLGLLAATLTFDRSDACPGSRAHGCDCRTRVGRALARLQRLMRAPPKSFPGVFPEASTIASIGLPTFAPGSRGVVLAYLPAGSQPVISGYSHPAGVSLLCRRPNLPKGTLNQSQQNGVLAAASLEVHLKPASDACGLPFEGKFGLVHNTDDALAALYEAAAGWAAFGSMSEHEVGKWVAY